MHFELGFAWSGACVALLAAACSGDGDGRAGVDDARDRSAETTGATRCAGAACAAEDAWRCSESTLQWCDDGCWRDVVDCAARGETCQAAETPEGFTCVAAAERCSGNVTRCAGAKLLQACIDGAWQDVEECPARCDVADGLGRCVLPEPCLRGGQERCRGTVVEECVDHWWTDARDCADEGKVCEPILGLTQVVRCAEPTLGAELDPCSPAVSGTCEPALACLAPDGGAVARCFASCDPAVGASCGPDRACAPAAAADAGGVCFDATGARDGACGEDDAVRCAPDAGECTRTQTDPDVHRCKLRCESVDIGRSGGCPDGELCLASRFFFSQSPEVRCAYRGEPGVCDEAGGYRCDTVSGVVKCLRWQGWCGALQPLVGAFDSASLAAYAGAGHRCEDSDDHRMCGIPDAEGIAAEVSCRDLGTHGGQRVFGCVAFCAGTGDGGDLDCGAGFHCGQPSHEDARYFSIARDAAGERIVCSEGSDAGCDVEAGYRCHGPFGDDYNCATPSRMCLSSPSDPAPEVDP